MPIYIWIFKIQPRQLAPDDILNIHCTILAYLFSLLVKNFAHVINICISFCRYSLFVPYVMCHLYSRLTPVLDLS